MAKPERRETSDAKKGPIQDLREWLPARGGNGGSSSRKGCRELRGRK